ncbi:MAG TPA: ribose-5-phosphate isomerase RpiA [Alkalispirochaeta sp.]|nr:ribose-5-phosphate isomerase RpiA [Alkalispirochaeta sp.]
MMETPEIKQNVAHTVTERVVQSGMTVGLGTGSTAIHAVRRIGALLAEGAISDILAVATSFESTIEAQRLGIPVRTLNDPQINGAVDIAIDGADEVDVRTGYLIKGGGGALTLEKLVEYNAGTLYVVVDESKLSVQLGRLYPIPVEIIPAALASARRMIGVLGLRPELRMAQRKAGPVVTDNGNLILDVHLDGTDVDADALEDSLNAIPGVLENGLFTRAHAEIWVGRKDGTVERAKLSA